MKKQIYMKSWLAFHERTEICPTDEWYLDFANQLFSEINRIIFHPKDVDRKECFAITLATYVEDCVSSNYRGWLKFTKMYHKRYGKHLPFYQPSAMYRVGKINYEDICFLMWDFSSRVDMFNLVQVEDPFSADLTQLSAKLYRFIDRRIGLAPVSKGLSGDWVIKAEYMKIEQTPVPDIRPDDVLSPEVERFLEATGGNPLMFCCDYKELKAFFINVLKRPNKRELLMPELRKSSNMVLYVNARGLIVAPEVGSCFDDDRNLGYDEMMTAIDGYSLFCDKGSCPFDLLKYAMAHNYLPEAGFPFPNGKQFLRDNWDFLARWFLRECFEKESVYEYRKE